MSTLVVSDTGPLQYLILCDFVSVLPKLFDRVVVPSAVKQELFHPSTPLKVRKWIETAPAWAEFISPIRLGLKMDLGAGETEAITLAQELRADAVLLDDQKARIAGTRLGLCVIGTLAILENASKRNLLDLRAAIATLRLTNFRINPRLLEEALKRQDERNRRNPPAAKET